VTPATIHQTICVPGYTTTIRPPVSESNRLKRRAPLAQAQHAIATDWVGAYCAARLPRCRDGVHFS
jgi:hypothetical protein